jgi:N-acetylmuramoyl-L-alanine amidase
VGAPLRSGLLATLSLLCAVPQAQGARIVDYQAHLGPRFEKRTRKSTRFIIVHSTECRLRSALRTLSRGKARHGRFISQGGHANYLVGRDGTIYRILDPRYRADHAGVSMWKGVQDLSDHSLGIELEGFHDQPFSAQQYRSLKWLLDVLRRRYRIASRDVLEHCRVAYTKPNRFYARNWRGRKRDPGIDNFDRRRAGLNEEYAYDPDVVAGRLGGDRSRVRPAAASAPRAGGSVSKATRVAQIGPGHTAWSIAGPRHRQASTLYVFPDGKTRRGDEIRDWSGLPAGTAVYLDVPARSVEILSAERTAWRIAGGDFDAATTLYAFPDGTSRRGDEIVDWSELPDGTRVHLGVPDGLAASAVARPPRAGG